MRASCQGPVKLVNKLLINQQTHNKIYMVVVIFNQPVLDGFTVARDKQGTSLTVPWLRLHTSNAGAWVQSLVRELRSQMPLCGVTKKKNERKRTEKKKRKEIMEIAPLRQTGAGKKKERETPKDVKE